MIVDDAEVEPENQADKRQERSREPERLPRELGKYVKRHDVNVRRNGSGSASTAPI